MDVTVLNKFLIAAYTKLQSDFSDCVVSVGAPDTKIFDSTDVFIWISPNIEGEPHLYNFNFTKSDVLIMVSAPTLTIVLTTIQLIRNKFHNVELSLGEGFTNINTYAPHTRFFEDIYEGKRRFFGQILVRQRSTVVEEEEGEED